MPDHEGLEPGSRPIHQAEPRSGEVLAAASGRKGGQAGGMSKEAGMRQLAEAQEDS